MANNKYKYYVVKDGKIASKEFKEFKLAVPTLLTLVDGCRSFNAYCAIVKLKEDKDLSRISIPNAEKSEYYTFVRFGSKIGSQNGPNTKESSIEDLKKQLSTYGGNHCEFMGIVKSDNAKKTFEQIKSLN